VTEPAGRIIVLRHGQTDWSRDGRHTGLTDIPLTAVGERLAAALAPRFADLDVALCLASPLQRAQRTARLAGLRPEAEPALVERHYGYAEGRSTAALRELTGDPEWDVWDADLTAQTGIAAAEGAYVGPGESLGQVAERIDPVLARCAPVVRAGRVCVLVAHSHVLRILTARWLGLGPATGRHLVLDAAHLAELGYERSTAALLSWNRSG
jgi:probable phosphoglycerate mutase